MKALTLWEPWATAMALGLKHNETRPRPISYRGELAICSAKRPMDPVADLVYRRWVAGHGPVNHLGFVLCVVEVFDCVATADSPKLSKLRLCLQELALGDYSRGRYAIQTRGLVKLERPVPVRGMQGLFELPPEVEAAVRRQL